MAYTTLSQTADPATDDLALKKLTSASTPSPTIPELPIAPFSLDFGLVPGHVAVDDPMSTVDKQSSKVSKLLSSLTGSSNSYDLVEDDDYEQAELPTAAEHDMATVAGSHTFHPVEDPPVRTASISQRLPLNHPKPDLQSLQGAYVKNVERLEETAERLSMTSSLEGEIRKMKMYERQKERASSVSSRGSRAPNMPSAAASALANSIIDVNATARSGGYSPAAYITSPVGSIRSSHAGPSSLPTRRASTNARLAQTQPRLAFDPQSFGDEFKFEPFQPTSVLEPSPSLSRSVSNASQHRPGSAGSGDTYQQAKTLFTDFDGVHYSAAPAPGRRISLSRPPRARDSRAFKAPQPGEEMIYYPAPVPVMLNLPVRLSKMNWSEREKKRLQALSDLPDDNRKSAPWLTNEHVTMPANRQSMARLPPQLRASAFFDHRGTEQNVQLKDGSAVATLDSILDAAAHAPVSAFTDHPIVGHLGKEVYGPSSAPKKSQQTSAPKKAKKKSSINNLLQTKESNIDLSGTRSSRIVSSDMVTGTEHVDVAAEHEDGAPKGSDLDESGEEDGSDVDSEADASGEEQEDDHLPGFSTAPTTLLAELQMRKAQQKLRNRTAADAFPNGMHSTLLELDTVTQLQQKARKQKHITLAWEDREQADKENYDDDDVPLGVLFTEKDRQDHVNVHRPLGLMEKRELEENEPLSSRRARLRGEPLVAASGTRDAAAPGANDDIPRLEEPSLEENPEETLGQRLKRLRELKENGSASDFAREMSSELGLAVDAPELAPSKTPDVEETLGQRRRRLKEEALKNGNGTELGSRPVLKPTRSMADLLQHNPVGYVHPGEAKTATTAMQSYQQQMNKNPAYLAQQQAALTMMNPGYSAQVAPSSTVQAPFMGGYAYTPYSVPMAAASTHTSMPGYGMQMPLQMPMQMQMSMPINMNMNMNTNTNTNINMGMGMGMGMPNMAHAYTMTGYAPDPNGFGLGPPLNDKQRANIDRWRQGIA